MKEYRFINLFRAFAALWVLLGHCQIWGGYALLPIPEPGYAVDLFMVVSGFLMMLAATRSDMADNGVRLRFWTRRFFRIAPVYYLALVLSVVCADYLMSGRAALQAYNTSRWIGSAYDAAGYNYTLDNIVAHVTFIFGVIPKYSLAFAMPDWSLSLEMQFYLVLPLLALAARKHPAALIAIGLMATWVVLPIHYPAKSLLFFKLQYFIAGMLLFKALHADRLDSALMMTAAISLSALESLDGGKLLLPYFIGAMWALGALEISGRTPVLIDRAIRSSVVRFASDVSYSVYLFHGMMMMTFGALFAAAMPDAMERTMAMTGFVLVTAYLVAYLVFVSVETRGIAIGKAISARRADNISERSIGA